MLNIQSILDEEEEEEEEDPPPRRSLRSKDSKEMKAKVNNFNKLLWLSEFDSFQLELTQSLKKTFSS